MAIENQEGSKLYDRLMARGVVIEPTPRDRLALESERRRLYDALGKSQVFDIQNVADYFHQFVGPDRKVWKESDFPNVAPPFGNYFMEFRVRKSWDFIKGGPIHAIGVGNIVERLKDGWDVESTVFMEEEKGRPKAWTRFYYRADLNGNLFKTHDDPTRSNLFGGLLAPIIDRVPIGDSAPIDRILSGDTYALYYPVLLALSFLHCKNVTVATNEPNPKLSRVFQKKRGRPLTRFHTLEIEPMKEVLIREGEVEKMGLRRALHIVRGHFATYSEEHPMFGRMTGTFYRPAHVRGSINEGIILKDYEVHTPKQQNP